MHAPEPKIAHIPLLDAVERLICARHQPRKLVEFLGFVHVVTDFADCGAASRRNPLSALLPSVGAGPLPARPRSQQI